jgi:hypothetical protein
MDKLLLLLLLLLLLTVLPLPLCCAPLHCRLLLRARWDWVVASSGCPFRITVSDLCLGVDPLFIIIIISSSSSSRRNQHAPL